MSTVQGDIYEVTIEGQYYGFQGGQKAISNYSVTVRMDEQAKKAGFLSVARNKVLTRALKAKYPDYKRFRTHAITGVVNVSRPGEPIRELALMNRKQIVAYIYKKNMPIEVDLYPEVSDLRQAIKSYRESREMFLKMQAKRKTSKGPDMLISRSIDELNPHLDQPQFSPQQALAVQAGVDPAYVQLSQHQAPDLTDGEYNPNRGWEEPAELPDDSVRIPSGTSATGGEVIISEFDDSDELDEMLAGL